MDWFDLLAVQGTPKSLLQHHSSKASVIWHSVFFTVQLSNPYVTTGKSIALTRWTFVGKVTSLLFNMLSRLVITFLPRNKHVLISWLQSPYAVILKHHPPTPDKVSHCFHFFPTYLPWSDGTGCHQNKTQFPPSQTLPSGSFHKPLILITQRAYRMKTTITEN